MLLLWFLRPHGNFTLATITRRTEGEGRLGEDGFFDSGFIGTDFGEEEDGLLSEHMLPLLSSPYGNFSLTTITRFTEGEGVWERLVLQLLGWLARNLETEQMILLLKSKRGLNTNPLPVQSLCDLFPPVEEVQME